MRESALGYHNLEWPVAGARLAGPIVWLRGWAYAKPGHDFIDVRVRHDGGTHLGILGLPRADLAAHFKSPRTWVPAEFIIGVPVRDGSHELLVEAMDAHGRWHALQAVPLTVAPDGTPSPRVEGRLEIQPTGAWTVRDPHHPFHGHLDDPGAAPGRAQGRAPVFGWLLDEDRPIGTVLATTDTLGFNHLEHSLTDEALAAKVPQHARARHARVRGAVDLPATLIGPACLRVYAESPEGEATLCFAQRLTPKASPPTANPATPDYRPAPARALSALPSGRPRRLLLVVRSLWFNDATLRALDLARSLVTSQQWAARVVSAEDGPLRHAFEAAGVESLVVKPQPLFSATDEPAMQAALAGLRRQIWWGHLDAAAVFDPICGWAIPLARVQGIPTLLDCGIDVPLQPDLTAIPAVQKLLRQSWREADAVCFTSAAAARAQAHHLNGRPAQIIPQWHAPQLPLSGNPNEPLPRVALAPLRTADWLARHHPESAARWRLRQGPATYARAESLAQQDDALAPAGFQRVADWSVTEAGLCLGPLFGRGPLRPLLDAAAAAVPLVAARTPTTEEWFAGALLPFVEEDNPLALAHALLAHEAAPALLRRQALAATELIRQRHAPEILLPRWAELLASVAATRG